MDDPIITTRAAAQLLGISIRTAQTWIESNALESWKTPGGHRRVRRSAVLALRARLSAADPKANALVLVQADEINLARYREVFAAMPECTVVFDSDTFASMLTIGRTLPAVVLVDLGRADWDRFAMLRRVLHDPELAHTQIVAITDIGAAQLMTELGTSRHVSRVPSNITAEALMGIVQTLARNTGAVPGEGASGSEAQERMPYPVPANEAQRVLALRRTGLIDSPYEAAFDRLAWLTARTLSAPMSMISLLTPERQWFKAHYGLTLRETPRMLAFCNHAIMQHDVFVVENAATDPHFKDNPYVTGEPGVRFYAGAPLIDPDGYALGALCVVDVVPRQLDDDQRAALKALAELASDKINLRLKDRQLRWAGSGNGAADPEE
ncbi:GAF domain-containing protein [Paraburkholderia sp. DHOC27]|nr:GAF domain-containing protein [Paraburkholderia sp. DHOC27]